MMGLASSGPPWYVVKLRSRRSPATRKSSRTADHATRHRLRLLVLLVSVGTLTAVFSVWLVRQGAVKPPPSPPNPPFPIPECTGQQCILWNASYPARIRGIALTDAGPTAAFAVGDSTQGSLSLFVNGSITRLGDLAFKLPYCCADPPLAVSQDGRYLAYGNDRLMVWDLSTRQPLWTFDFPGDGDQINESALGLDVSPDGSRLAVVTMNFEGSPPRLWLFTADGRVLWSVDLPSAYPWPPRFSVDGTTLVVSLAKDVLVFDSSAPTPRVHWSTQDWVLAGNLDVSADGRVFAITSSWMPGRENARLFYFDRERGLLWTRDLNLGSIDTSLDLSPDGRTVLVVDRRNGTLAAFDSAGAEIFRRDFSVPTSNGVLRDDGRTVLIGAGRDVRLLRLIDRTEVTILQADESVQQMVLSDPYFAIVQWDDWETQDLALGRLG